MIEIEKPRIESLDLLPDGTYGKFVLEPLENGFGTTIGNKAKEKGIFSNKNKFVPQIAYIENNKIQLDNITKELLENYSLS